MPVTIALGVEPHTLYGGGCGASTFERPRLEVARSTIPGAGRGVFTQEPIAEGAVVEVAPFIEVPTEPLPVVLQDCAFAWVRGGRQGQAIVLGYGSLYNHSEAANLDWRVELSARSVVFTALRSIEPWEELFIHYGPGYWTSRQGSRQAGESR